MSTIKANTLLHSDGSTTTQPSIPALDKRMAKAWVNFNPNGVVVSDSYGVSSMTDIGVGNYRVNLSNTMTNALYMGTATAGGAASGASFTYHGTVHSKNTTHYGINTSAFNVGTTLSDCDTVYSVIFGS